MTPQEIDALFARTLDGDYDDEAPWEAVNQLRATGERVVFEKAADWCKSDDPMQRARGANILAQLRPGTLSTEHSFPEEQYSAVASLLEKETEVQPLRSAIHALGNLDNPACIPLIVRFANHPNSDIRFAMACALGHFPNHSSSAASLLALTRDTNDDVRNWAVFGLGVQGDLDSPEIREALVERLTDSCAEAREEAMIALAKRKDRRVLSVLLPELEQKKIKCRVLEAAYTMLGMDEDQEDWTGADYIKALEAMYSV